MNWHNTSPQDHNEAIPADLASVAAALDALGRHDRASAPSTTEGRIFLASRAGLQANIPSIPVAETAAALDDLGAAERESARTTLEDRIFVATRALIASAPGRAAPAIVQVRPFAWGRLALRVAAAIALAGGLGYLYLSREQPTGTEGGSPASTVALQEALDRDAELLGTVLRVAFSSSDSESYDASGDAGEQSNDWFDLELLDEGSL